MTKSIKNEDVWEEEEYVQNCPYQAKKVKVHFSQEKPKIKGILSI